MSNLKDPVAFLGEHYVYEISMLKMTYDFIQHETEQWKRNAFMESFAIHARVLRDFYLKSPNGDDVAANHFVPPGSQFSANHTSKIAPGLWMRINKQVPHLTRARENTVKIQYSDRKALYDAIMADHALFKNEIDATYRGCFGNEVSVIVQGGNAGSTTTNEISSVQSEWTGIKVTVRSF